MKTYGNAYLWIISGDAVIFLGTLEEFLQERLARSLPYFWKNIKDILAGNMWNGEQAKACVSRKYAFEHVLFQSKMCSFPTL